MYFEINTKAIHSVHIHRPFIMPAPQRYERYGFIAEYDPTCEMSAKLPKESIRQGLGIRFNTHRPISFFGLSGGLVRQFEAFNLDLDVFLTGAPARIIGKLHEVGGAEVCTPMAIKFLVEPEVPTYESFLEAMPLARPGVGSDT